MSDRKKILRTNPFIKSNPYDPRNKSWFFVPNLKKIEKDEVLKRLYVKLALSINPVDARKIQDLVGMIKRNEVKYGLNEFNQIIFYYPKKAKAKGGYTMEQWGV